MMIGIPKKFAPTIAIQGPIPRGATLECIGLCMGGEVRENTVSAEHFDFEILACEDGDTVIGTSRKTAEWLPLNAVFPAFYTLTRALSHQGCLVLTTDPQVQFLDANPRETLTFEWQSEGFFLPRGQKGPLLTLDYEILDEIYRALSGPESLAERVKSNSFFQKAFPNYSPTDQISLESLLQHRSGLEIFVTPSGHRIAGKYRLSAEEKRECEESMAAISGIAMTLEMTREEILELAVPLRPIEDLLAGIEPKYRHFLQRVDEEFYEVWAYSDFGRSPIPEVQAFSEQLPDGEKCELVYEPITDWELLPELSLLRLNGMDFRKTFIVRCGEDVFWGDNGSGNLIWLKSPGTVYQFRMRG